MEEIVGIIIDRSRALHRAKFTGEIHRRLATLAGDDAFALTQACMIRHDCQLIVLDRPTRVYRVASDLDFFVKDSPMTSTATESVILYAYETDNDRYLVGSSLAGNTVVIYKYGLELQNDAD